MAQDTMSSCLFLSVSLVILSQFFFIPKSTAAPRYWTFYCPNTTMFANNSHYQSNLNTVFHSLSSNATVPSGYAQASALNGSNATVYGHFLCRGDIPPSTCQDCVITATISDLPQHKCPNRKEAIIWYDECMVRYSNASFWGTMSVSPWFPLKNTQNITGNMTRFMDSVRDMMNDVMIRALDGGKKFGTGVAPYSTLQTMYGMGQCTPDLNGSECERCLRIAVERLPTSIGGRAILPSCNVRYEIYPFLKGGYFNASLRPPAPTPSISVPGRRKKISTKVIIAIVAPIALVSLVLIFLGICFAKKKSKKHDPALTGKGEDIATTENLQFNFTTLQSATLNFAEENKLGEGGFGSVYMGTLSGGQNVAVKRLSRSSSHGVEEFKNEVMLVAKLQHRNLVRLLGYCLEGEEMLLVYEYVSNKSLDLFLFDAEKQGRLDWGRRYNIISGVSRGMLYLHHDSRLTIIHRDLKASNILLDINMNPKISDFGMAKIFEVDQTQSDTSRLVGSYGYMSPEYAMHGKFSTKSDVYSFGVLLLEIISGKKNSSFYQLGYSNDDLLSYAWKHWIDGKAMEFVDPTIRDSCAVNEVIRSMHLGLLCVQESIEDRPTMSTSVLILDSHSVTLPSPQGPAYFVKNEMNSMVAKDSKNNITTSGSINDVSITEIEPQ